MPTTLYAKANEESTYVIPITFRDEDGEAVVPTTATWTLTDLNGAVINEKEDEAFAGLASSVNLVLSGDDLALPEGRGVQRQVIVRGTYTSDLGSGLPFVDVIYFEVETFVGV